ncbi:MAG: acetoacetate decarboxylase family protein [Geodermatophilaceae bacterium]|nr:acetoacetate decarboxylase family protein [Geodermatophilaceae bacterium]
MASLFSFSGIAWCLVTQTNALAGFTSPYTPTGRSALIPAPPWHYAGQLMSLELKVARDAAQALLPAGFTATGMGAAHFCDWQSTTDGTELLDPVYAQYKELILLVEAEYAGQRVFYCPFIYVDQDLSLARGWLQGWPKKIGSVWITRSYALDHPAAAPLRAGVRLGASLAVKDRRLAEAAINLTGEGADPIGFLAAPAYGLVASTTLLGDAPDRGTPTLARAVMSEKQISTAHGATGELQLYASPRDEVSLLGPEEVVRASTCAVALTVDGATTQ